MHYIITDVLKVVWVLTVPACIYFSLQDKKAFADILRRISKIQKTNGHNYVVLREKWNSVLPSLMLALPCCCCTWGFGFPSDVCFSFVFNPALQEIVNFLLGAPRIERNCVVSHLLRIFISTKLKHGHLLLQPEVWRIRMKEIKLWSWMQSAYLGVHV